jgi:hypothetical protein
MNEHIALAIQALERMRSRLIIETETGYVWPKAGSRVAEIDEAIAFMRTMDNTMRIHVDLIVDLQRQLTQTDEALALARGHGD